MKKHISQLLLFLLFFNATSVLAQRNVRIKILEAGSMEPISGVAVSFAEDKSLKEISSYAITDAKGFANIKLPSKKLFYKAQMMGYNPMTGILGSNDKYLNLNLKESATSLDEIVVTANNTRPVKFSPVLTQVLTGKAMREAGYGNLQQVLQQETPGLNIQKVGFGNEISMQGLDARHVMFLLDGERMTGDMAGNIDYERFNLHAIDHIEIVKGASSTLYGSRASGAVINLITKKPTKAFSCEVGARYGQMNERNYKNPSKKDFLYMYEKNVDRPNLQSWMSMGIKKGIFGSQTDLLYSESDAFYLYQSDHDVKVYTKEANPFLKKDVVVESRMPRPPMGVEGTEHFTGSQKFFIEPLSNFKIQLYGNVFFMNTYDMIQDLVFTQSRDWSLGTKISYSLKDYFTVTLKLHSDFYDRFKRHELRDERLKVYKSRILQPNLNITSQYFKNHNLIFGVEYFSDVLTSDRFVNRKMTSRELREAEFYLQDEWSISPKLMISTGVRSNYSHQFGLMAMPKVAIRYAPNENWTLRANASLGYRSPSIKELFFNWDHLGMFQIKGNEYLRPERNRYLSFSAEYSKNGFFINGALFGNFFTKKIEGVWRIYDLQYNFEYTNLGHQNLLGGEILMKWRLADWLSLNANYSYVNVSTLEGLKINTSSPHAATAGINYDLNKNKYKLKVGVNASFTGEKKFDVQDRLYIEELGRSKDAYFRCKLPAYVLCNLVITQTFDNKVRLMLGVNNLFNYKPKTLGSGLTAFNVPATPGARFYIQTELLIDQIAKIFRKK
ncbi:TonB-dependent receptor [Porphyromonas pogonae]|uniref:TonB-dependent receptor n=1 Tax=Porphyromonas pogonae TaxID=867595 RepID=UPI002E760AC9|nr:TonB-dependent receptor [Porphyromonas pogonae]